MPASRRKKVRSKVPGQPPARGGMGGARRRAAPRPRRALPGGGQLSLGRGQARCSPPALLSAQPAASRRVRVPRKGRGAAGLSAGLTRDSQLAALA